MKLIYLILLCLILIGCVVGFFYAIVSGIWGFNPTHVLWFNTKLAVTCVAAFLITNGLLKLTFDE